MLELAVFADREAVNAMAGQVHAMHVSWRPDIYTLVEEQYPEERFRNAIRERQIYVAKLDDLPVGYVLIKIRDFDFPGVVKRKIMLVDELCVREECRRQGIGTQIMEDVRALAKAFRCTDLQLSVYPQNDDAVAFYQKCGFTIQSINMQRKV